MRLSEIHVTDSPPIKRFAVTNLSDVVVIAGRNGVGKTRLMQTLINYFRSPPSYPQIKLVFESTNEKEQTDWGKKVLNTSVPEDASILLTSLQQNKLRSSWKSSVVQFESDRSITQIGSYNFTWDDADPATEAWGWDSTFMPLKHRFQDTIHSIFRIVRSLDGRIARQAKELKATGSSTMQLDWADPLEQFKIAFFQLLAPKELVEADLKSQQLKYRDNGQIFAIDQLSSGEREVINIVFDFILRNPEDCVVFFDEPELHLHPELSFKLLQTLKNVGARNQFIFTTHSPDIITASLDQSVIFLAPSDAEGTNQAVPVREDDQTNQALRMLGQSVGVVALGRRLVLVEGESASLDKQVYGSILKSSFPNLVLVPVGGKEQLTSFNRVVTDVLEKTIWGVDFFMLCDRDALPFGQEAVALEERSHGRLRVLKRYHLENYFLDANVLAKVFSEMEPEGSWLRDAKQINEKLREIARGKLSYAVSLGVAATFRQRVGNVDLMAKGCDAKSSDEVLSTILTNAQTQRARVENALTDAAVTEVHRSLVTSMTQALDAADDRWKVDVPGRPVFNAFCSIARLHEARLKQLYIVAALKQNQSVFDEIVGIFRDFSEKS